MLFYYDRTFFLPKIFLNAVNYLIDSLDDFSSYKARFVIFSHFNPGTLSFVSFERDCLFSYFFSYDGYWWTSRIGHDWNLEEVQGIAVAPSTLLGVLLKNRRGFLLQFGQRRVCARALSWFVAEFWSCWSFEGLRGDSNIGVFSRYAYRHLAQSDLFSAGVLLGQPNLYFFVYLLSNPYFWSLLQQTLSSQYRYK